MGTMYTPVFRVSFPSVFKKNEKSSNPKYEIGMLFRDTEKDKDDIRNQLTVKLRKAYKGKPKLESIESLMAEVDRVGKDKWGDKYEALKSKNKIKLPFHDGTDKEYDGYGEGVVFCTSRSKTQPGVLDQKCNRIIDEEELYAGCYAIASVNIYANDGVYDGVPTKSISVGLNNIQKIADGEPFSGRARAEEEFVAIDEPEDDDSDLTIDDL